MNHKKIIFALNLALLLSSVGCFNKSTSKGKFTLAKASYYEPVRKGWDFEAQEKAIFQYGYYSNEPMIPYIPLDEALTYLFYGTTINVEYEGSIGTYYVGDEDMTFIVDASNDVITAKNYSLMNLFSLKYDTPLGMIDEESTTAYTKNDKTTYSSEVDVVFNLRQYGLDIIHYQGDLFIPFAVVNYITFNNALWSSVVFNGKAFYLQDMISGASDLNYTSNGYNRLIYNNTSLRDKGKSKKFIEYNYQALMFNLDHFYGFNDQRFVPFNDYLLNNQPQIVKDLKDKNETTYCRAVEKLIETVIGDCHTNTGNTASVFSVGSYSMGRYTSERSIELSNNAYDCYGRRGNTSIKPNYVRYNGNTAIVSFDGFYHAGVKFTPKNIDNYFEDDSFALFHRSLKNIDARGDIENVIFDVTCNGGGDTNALIPMLGFLTKDVTLKVYNPLNKQTGTLVYNIDTNLDGVYDDDDCYAGKYNFYVLTSSFSFSCANAFPMACKQNNAAKIIGEQSGGGACVVYYSATPDGKTFRISGNMRFCEFNNSENHFDAGIPVDYELSRDYFYNDSYLNNFVNNL